MSAELAKILMVDDRPENLIAFEELIAQPDRVVFTAASGNEALTLMLKHDFAVVLLDVEMPEMDGYETAQHMRSGERSRAVPILFVTAGDRAEQRAFRGYELGAVDFLYKPINALVLRSKVDVFVALHRRTQELAEANAALGRAEAVLRERVADLESVNQTLSHDLRGPIRTVLSFGALLAESLAGKLDGEAAEHLGRVTRASQRMARMIDDLYRLLRLSAGEQSVRPTDSAAVLAGVLDDLRSDIERTGAAVGHGPLPTVAAHPTLLGQVFLNLIANALKFRAEAPLRVDVTADRQGASWRFTVADNGAGIAPDFLPRLFGVFQRAGGDGAEGSGIGLALCRRAVEKMGGRIWAESPPGQGTRFHFTLPA